MILQKSITFVEYILDILGILGIKGTIASKFIERLQELIEIAGDVKIVIQLSGYKPERFEEAIPEIQNVVPSGGDWQTLKNNNTESVIKVW